MEQAGAEVLLTSVVDPSRPPVHLPVHPCPSTDQQTYMWVSIRTVTGTCPCSRPLLHCPLPARSASVCRPRSSCPTTRLDWRHRGHGKSWSACATYGQDSRECGSGGAHPCMQQHSTVRQHSLVDSCVCICVCVCVCTRAQERRFAAAATLPLTLTSSFAATAVTAAAAAVTQQMGPVGWDGQCSCHHTPHPRP